MSTIEKYELLKNDGTLKDRIRYVLSLSNKDQLESYLKERIVACYDDLHMFRIISIINKNDKNLFQLFQNESLPVYQRISALKNWMKFQTDEKTVLNFIVQLIRDKINSQWYV